MHWQLEWRKPINKQYVNYTRRFLKRFPYENGTKAIIDRAEIVDYNKNPENQEYVLYNVSINGYSEGEKGAVFFYDDIPLHLHYSIYRVFFSIPKSNIIDYETQETHMSQQITITSWAYNNCYKKSLLRILENYGETLINIITGDPSMPMIKSSPYLKFREKILNINKNHNDNNDQKKNNESKENQKINNIKEPDKIMVDMHSKSKDKIPNNDIIQYCFYTDGAGNIYNNEKRTDKACFSVLLENTKEKWRHREDKLTNNQAEILGIMAALYISIKRKYNSIEIRTDSQNIVKWINGRDTHIKTNIEKKWKTKNQTIETYINRLVKWAENIPNIAVNWISRDRNKAHAI